MSQEHEYRVVATCPDNPSMGGESSATDDPKRAGGLYRQSRENLKNNGVKGTIELQRRPVAPWETVERSGTE